MMDRISICEALAKRNEIDPFLKRMVTGDKKWVTYFNIVRKRSWTKCGEATQTVAKPELTARKFTCRNCGGGDRGRVAIYRPFGEVSLSLNRTVTCMVLKANDRRTSCPCHDEFRGPRSDYVRQVVLATTTTTTKFAKHKLHLRMT
ncbi:uncharacterized protein TNCV_4834671 [Trichonephila clavipes]|nr:uncharacterized protein TNCV_4834671 [Trichonephila clavipes]